MGLLRMIGRWLMYSLSLLFPRDPNLWVFIGWRYSQEREIFAENPKYVYLHVAHNMPDVRPIWIGGDRKICTLLNSHGYEAYPYYSLRGIWYSLRAGYYLIGASLQIRNWKFSGGAKIVQLWHGKSLKKTGDQSPYVTNRRSRLFSPHLFTRYHRFVAISDYFAQYTKADFGLTDEQLLNSGLPKHDALLHPCKDSDIDLDTDLDNTIATARQKGAQRVILYGPTYRPDGSNPLPTIDLKILNETLTKTGDAMIISLHPKFSLRDWMPETELTNIYFSQGTFDKYPIMNKFDLLITDYSSLSIDFLLMGKLSILYAYDIETFKTEMGIYDELWDAMPGPKVYTFPDLLEVLTADLTSYQDKIPAAQRTLFDDTDGQSSQRIVAAMQA